MKHCIKKSSVKATSLIVAFVILMSMIPAFPVFATQVYSDQIESMVDNWTSDIASQWTIDSEKGALIAPSIANKPYYLFKENGYELGSYTFETDITLPNTTATLGGICFGVQDQGDVVSRYEFTVSYYNGGWCPRIYKRVTNVDGYSGYVCAGGHQKVDSSISITPGVPFNMKVVLNKLKMTVYINDNQVLSYDVSYSIWPMYDNDSSYEAGAILGCAGLMGFNNTNAIFDNVKFNAGGVVWTDGFEEQNIADYNGTVIHQDDFSQTDTTWEGGSGTFSGVSYAFSIENGVASVTAPKTDNVDKAMSVSLNRPASEMADEDYYCIKTTARITGDSLTPTKRLGGVAVQFAQDSQSGEKYEFRLSANGVLTVFKASTKVWESTLTNVTGESFQYGADYTLAIYVYDDIALLYINDTIASVFKEFGDQGITGFAAIRAIAGSVEFDDFVAASMNEKSDSLLMGISVYSMDTKTFVGTNLLTNFDADKFLLIARYVDGSIIPVNLVKADITDGNVSYGGKHCKVYLTDELFRESFSGDLNSKWTITADSNMSYTTVDGCFTTAYDASSGANGTLRANVSEGAQWSNYSVSTDFQFSSEENSKTQYIGVLGRYTNNSWYEFRMICRAGTVTAALYRFDDGSGTQLENYSSALLKSCVGSTVTTDKYYTMKMSMTGNLISVYLNGTLLGSYRDTADTALNQGTAGFRIINCNGSIDDFVAEVQGDGSIESFALSQFPDGNILIFQGNDIEIWHNDLIVNYADGTQIQVALKAEMLSDWDSSILGTHAVNVTYDGQTLPISITVVDQGALTEFCDALENGASFADLKKQYDSLSVYELSCLTEAQKSQYQLLIQENDCCVAPELNDDSVLLCDTLDIPSLKCWIDGVETNGGTWMQQNGVLYQAQTAYGASTTGWSTADAYGNITGVGADLALLSAGVYAGVGINVSTDGYYHACVSNTSGSYVLRLYRKVQTDSELVKSIDLSAMNLGDWFSLLLTIEDNKIRVYLNGQEKLSYEETDTMFNLGEAGIRIYKGDALVDNVRVYGTAQQRPAVSSDFVKNSYYTDNFEDEIVGKDPSHWVENYTQFTITDNWQIYNKEGNVYGTEAVGYTETYLYAFEHNPVISVRFMLSDADDNGEFGFITRMAPSTAFVFVGYDFSRQQWFVKSQTSEAGGTKYTYQQGNSVIETNRWYDAVLTLNGKKLVLKVDEEEILNLDDVDHTGYGRMGFYTENVSLFVDDYVLTMSSGDIPQDGVISYVIDKDTYNNAFEIETFDDGQTLLGVGVSSKFISKDAGLTWTEVTNNSAYSQVVAQNYTTLLKMSNGQYLQILMNNKMQVLVSDDLLNWTAVSTVVPEEDYATETGNLITIVHVNCATEVKKADGGSRIFVPVGYRRYTNSTSFNGHYTVVYYSDDYGYTWQKSETNTLELLPEVSENDGSSWCESKIIKCADGSLRMYYSRNRLGCMQYTVSYDEGVTWQGLYQIPEIQLPTTSFALMEDPTEPGTFYMVCCVGTPTYLGNSTPRTRFVLLRSYDGMNWEFVMNLERMTNYLSIQNGVALYQILDPSLLITDEYVYVSMGRSEREYSASDANSHQAQRIYYVRVEKDKMETRDWDASTLADVFYPKTIELESVKQTRFDLGEKFICEATVKLTDYLGNETYQTVNDVLGIPNTDVLGKHMVTLYFENGTTLDHTIDVYDAWAWEEEIYKEDFDTGLTQNWTGSIDKWTLEDGVLSSPANTSPLYLNRDDCYLLQDYVFEVELTMPDVVSNSTRLGGICFGIQDSDSATSRYEFTISYKDGGWCPRLYKRVSGVGGYSAIFCAGNYQTVDSRISVSPGESFIMKVVLDGTVAKCYVNDILVLSYTADSKDASYSDGAIRGGVALMGFQTAGVKFDDAKLYYLRFIGYREFFEDTNEITLNNKGWETEAADYSGASFKSDFWKIIEDVDNQYLAVRNRNTSLLYNTGEHNSNYVFQAEVFFDDFIEDSAGNQTTASVVNNGNTGIFFGLNEEGKGYEFCLIYKSTEDVWKCRLYNRVDTSINIIADLPAGVTFDSNQAVTLRVALIDESVYCYVNGCLVISHTRADGNKIVGDVALVSRLGSNATSDLVTYFDRVQFLHTPMAQVVLNGVVLDQYGTLQAAEKAVQTGEYGGQAYARSLVDVEKWNLVLGDNIGVNFFVRAVNADQTKVNVTINDQTYSFSVVNTEFDGEFYMFCVDLAAAQMTETITVELMVNGVTVKTSDYSLRQYADYILAGDYNDITKTLVKEMLNYGGAAQSYFDYNTNNLANNGIDGVGSLDVPKASETNMSVDGSVDGITLYGASLVLESKVAVRYYFTVNGDISNYSFTVEGAEYDAEQKSDGLYYVEIADINPQDLNHSIELVVNDSLTVIYGPMNYIVRKNATGSESLQALLKALYNYHLAALEYVK